MVQMLCDFVAARSSVSGSLIFLHASLVFRSVSQGICLGYPGFRTAQGQRKRKLSRQLVPQVFARPVKTISFVLVSYRLKMRQLLTLHTLVRTPNWCTVGLSWLVKCSNCSQGTKGRRGSDCMSSSASEFSSSSSIGNSTGNVIWSERSLVADENSEADASWKEFDEQRISTTVLALTKSVRFMVTNNSSSSVPCSTINRRPFDVNGNLSTARRVSEF